MFYLKKILIFVVLAELLLACQQPFKAGLGEKVDIEAPQFSIKMPIKPGSGSYLNGVAHFEGGVTDDIAVTSVEVQFNNGPWMPVDQLIKTDGGKSGFFKYDFNTLANTVNDGQVYFKFRVSDGKRITETQNMSYTIKNMPPQIKMTLPAIQEDAFDNPGLNTGNLATLYQGNDLMGMASDLGGIAYGYPQIMLWPAGEPLDPAAGVPLNPKWGTWREVQFAKPRQSGEALYAGAFSWPLLDLVSDPNAPGGWRLPAAGETVTDLPTGLYRFRIQVRDVAAAPIINTYPNRIDNSLGLTPDQHPNKYIEFNLIAATSPIIRIIHDPAGGKPFPGFYNGKTPFMAYLTVTSGNPPVTVKAKVSDNDSVDFSGGYTLAMATGGNGYTVAIPSTDSGFSAGGDKVLHLEATDRIGNVTTTSKSFYLDKVPPEISFFMPSGLGNLLNPPQVTSSVTLRGTTSDANRVAKLYYSLGKTQIANNEWHDTQLDTGMPLDNSGSQNEYVSHRWSNSLSSWSWRFTNIADFTTRISDLPSAAGGNSFVEPYVPAYNLWLLRIKFKAVDLAGNETIEECSLILDPDADTPHVYINSHQDGNSVGGIVPLRGTAEDNEWIDRVEIRISAQNSVQSLDPNPANWNVSTWDVITSDPLKYPNKTPDNFVPVNVISEGMVVSWFFELNSNDSLTPPAAWVNRGVQVEVRAGDADPANNPPSFKHYGPAQTLRLLFDRTVPTISPAFYRGDYNQAQTAPENEWKHATAGDGTRLANQVTLRARIQDDGGITSIKLRRQQDTLYGPSIINDNTPGTNPWVSTPPILQSGDTVSAGKKYFIKSLGNSNFGIFGGPNTEYATFTATSGGTISGNGVLVEANINTGGNSWIFEYTVYIALDTQTLWGGRYQNNAGTYNIEIQAEDNNTPSRYIAQNAVTVNIDNYAPMASFTGNPNVMGVYSLSGRAWDTGKTNPLPLSSTVNTRNIDKVVVYFSRNGSGISLWENHPQTASHTPVWINTQQAFENRNGNETAGATAAGTLQTLPFFPDVRQSDGTWKSTDSGIVIKGRSNAATDDGLNGNNYNKEFANDPVGISYVQIWEVELDTTRLKPGPVDLHYVVFDTAGNTSHYSQPLYLSNNRPDILSYKLGTDINGNGVVEAGEHSRSFTMLADGPAEMTTNFTIRNSRFNIMLETRAGSGNGQKHYKLARVTESGPVSAGNMTRGNVYKIASRGSTSFSFYGAPDNEVGTVFAASGPAPGSGTVLAYTETAGAVKSGTMGDIKNDILFGAGDFSAIPDTITAVHVNPDGTVNLQHGCKFIIKVYDETVQGSPPDEYIQLAHAALINLDIDNDDNIKPVTAVNPFYWNGNGEGNNSLVYNPASGEVLGHIELETDLPASFSLANGIMDGDPKVSGQISIRGTAYDNNIIESLWVKMDGFTFGSPMANVSGSPGYTQAAAYTANVLSGVDRWTAGGWRMTVTTISHDQDGHRVNWKLDIDTDRHSPITEADQVFRIAARDFVTHNDSLESNIQTSASVKTARYRMDIVPYISAIETPVRTSGGLKGNNIRSADGKYSIMRVNANTIRIRGFNLAPASANGVRILTQAQQNSYNPTAPAAGTALASTAVPGTPPNTSYDLTNMASLTSGWLTVYTNGIGTLNNINNNNSLGSFVKAPAGVNANNGYNEENMPNREADRYVTKNITLSDDRYLQFYSVKKTNVKNGYYPVMLMNNNNPVFGYLDLSGGPSEAPIAGNTGENAVGGAGIYQASHAMPQRTEFNIDSGGRLYTEYLIKASIWDGMGMAQDESGRYIHASTYNRDNAFFHVIYDRYAEIETTGNNSPIGGTGWGQGTTYQNYTGNMAGKPNNNAIVLEDVNFSPGLLLDRYQYPKIIAKGNSRTNAGVRCYMSYYDNGAGELIFRNFKIGTSSTAIDMGPNAYSLSKSGSDAAGNVYNGTYTNLQDYDTAGRLTVAANASSHFDMAISSGDVAVIACYDEAIGKLVIKYSGTAISGLNPANTIIWNNSPANIHLPSYTGMYISMVMDASDGLHIAAFDAVDSDLKYIYIPNYAAANVYAVTVDQYGSVGNWTDIKLHPATRVPYIAYYNATETGGRDTIKLAYAKNQVNTPAQVKAGVDANGYTTGNWEYATVPAIDPPQGGSSKFQKVNLGFRTDGRPVLGYLGTNIEFSYPVGE
jgi:hypothetical protein